MIGLCCIGGYLDDLRRELVEPELPFLVVGLVLLILPWSIFFIRGKFAFGCSYCKGFFALKRLRTDLVGEESISVKMEVNDKDSNGVIIGSREQYVPGTRKKYQDTFICRKCGKTCKGKVYHKDKANV